MELWEIRRTRELSRVNEWEVNAGQSPIAAQLRFRAKTR